MFLLGGARELVLKHAVFTSYPVSPFQFWCTITRLLVHVLSALPELATIKSPPAGLFIHWDWMLSVVTQQNWSYTPHSYTVLQDFDLVSGVLILNQIVKNHQDFHNWSLACGLWIVRLKEMNDNLNLGWFFCFFITINGNTCYISQSQAPNRREVWVRMILWQF